MRRWRFTIFGALGVGLLILPWWRNHAILQDFYDYGLVMAGAGRIELGERPYVDFTTPIQTLQLLAAVWAEKIWGARYLSLTYVNAVFIVGSFVGLAAMLRPRFGSFVALLVAAAIVMASSVQHTIIWYNAMGVFWLAVIVWLTPRADGEPKTVRWNLLCVCAALWLGGMTKLTYQIAALAFAVAFTMRAGVLETITWRAVRVRLLAFFVFGVLAPIGSELVFTGASLEQWLENVVVLPARFRTEMLGQIFTAGFYLHTPHDYYKPLHFTYAGAWGLALLAVITGIVAGETSGQSPRRRWRLGSLAVLVLGSWICGSVLLATNMDIAYLSGAAWLVLAIGVTETLRPTTAAQPIRVVMAVAALSLLIPATISAWSGTRALWGHAKLVRNTLVSTDDLPARFAYVKGMRVFPTFHDSMTAYAARQDELVASGVPLSAFLFVNGTEWMGRVVPEARHSGLPLWWAAGTTYSEADASVIGDRLEHDPDIRVVVSYAGWTYWYAELRAALTRSFVEARIGPRVDLFVRLKALDPLEVAINTQSSIHAGEMSIRGGPVRLNVAANGLFYLGAENSHRIDFASPVYRMTGEMVGELNAGAAGGDSELNFQVRARENGRLADVLWEEKVLVKSGERWFVRPFAVSTGGRPVSLLLRTSGGLPGRAGWRKLQIEHAGPLTAAVPGPLDPTLGPKPIAPAGLPGLFGAGSFIPAEIKAFGQDARIENRREGPALVTRGASEVWFKVDRSSSRFAGEYRVAEEPARARPLRIAVIVYKSGRFDVAYRKDLPPRHDGVESFEIGIPEGVAWIGMIVAPLDGADRDARAVTWRNLKIW